MSEPVHPNHWATSTLGQVTTKITSGSRDWKPFYGRGRGVFILTQNVRMRTLDLSEPFLVDPPPDDPARARSAVEPEDLLVNIVGATGVVARVAQPLPEHYVCQSVALVRPAMPAIGRWLEIYLAAPATGQAYFKAKTYGMGRPHLSFADLKDMPVALPPLAEQARLVEQADALLRDIETGRQHFLSALDGFSRLRASCVEHCWDSPHVREKPLRDVLTGPLINGRSVPTADAGVPVLRLTALRDGQIDTNEAKIGAWDADAAAPFLIAGGDFLVARGNGSLDLVGRGGHVPNDPPPVAFPDTLIRVRVDADVVRPAFLRLAWNSHRVRRQIESQARTTAGIYKINQQILRDIEIPVPPLSEQDRLIAEITCALEGLVPAERCMAAQVAAADRLEQAVLNSAVTGKLVPRTPDSESGRELLDQIELEVQRVRNGRAVRVEA